MNECWQAWRFAGILSIGLGIACFAAAAVVEQTRELPSVSMDGAVYYAKDFYEIEKIVDRFDAEIARRNIDLEKGGYRVELRLIKGD